MRMTLFCLWPPIRAHQLHWWMMAELSRAAPRRGVVLDVSSVLRRVRVRQVRISTMMRRTRLSAPRETMKQASQDANDCNKTSLDSWDSAKWSRHLHPFRSHFSGQQGSWLRCFRLVAKFPQQHVPPEQNNAAQKVCLGRSTCRAGRRDLPFGGYLVRCNVGDSAPARPPKLSSRDCNLGVSQDGRCWVQPSNEQACLVNPPSGYAVLQSTHHHPGWCVRGDTEDQ